MQRRSEIMEIHGELEGRKGWPSWVRMFGEKFHLVARLERIEDDTPLGPRAYYTATAAIDGREIGTLREVSPSPMAAGNLEQTAGGILYWFTLGVGDTDDESLPKLPDWWLKEHNTEREELGVVVEELEGPEVE
jgi:hypothetical protein